ncbi:hypothetical protein [Jannaschia sp. CCS1]|uniref:hypothetical protein n=1 Tax=Jannaschia sp. (strain CCS1) TaxID=290400 RepID=UPI000053D3CF|nr:hypothetical protein [Jannaschia sp. CCS1]ABD54028.1 hypothetical protein Jann_1111 [Jannaschia sp. CCS1]
MIRGPSIWICAVVLLSGLASAAVAQSRDAVFQTLWQDMNGTLLGNVYSQPTSVSGAQDWTCETCAPGQRIRIGWYDWAYTYDTDDASVVLRRIAGACQFDPCTTEAYDVDGLTGLIQHGTHRTGEAARSFLIVGDRLWSLYVQGMPTVDAALALLPRAERAILPLILAADP